MILRSHQFGSPLNQLGQMELGELPTRVARAGVIPSMTRPGRVWRTVTWAMTSPLGLRGHGRKSIVLGGQDRLPSSLKPTSIRLGL